MGGVSEARFAYGMKDCEPGWALSALRGDRAHYFEPWGADMALALSDDVPGFLWVFDSLCGIVFVATDSVPLLKPGNWPRCKRCEKSLAKAAL
jgi:hypothetical protein